MKNVNKNIKNNVIIPIVAIMIGWGSWAGWIYYAFSIPEVKWYHWLIMCGLGIIVGYIIFNPQASQKMTKSKAGKIAFESTQGYEHCNKCGGNLYATK